MLVFFRLQTLFIIYRIAERDVETAGTDMDGLGRGRRVFGEDVEKVADLDRGRFEKPAIECG